ncbi:MAG TPA: ABC transporter permease [Chloroflexota bacterium]|jgi:NitT/TauT family transport system permease protein
MAEQVIARKNVGQGLGMLAFVLLGGLVIGIVLQVILALVAGTMGAALSAGNVVVALVWPVWAIVAVEAIYAKIPPYQRIMPLGTARAIVGFLALIFLWQIVASYLFTNALVIVPLSKVWDAFLKLARSGELWKHTSVSLQEAALGFTSAAVVGVGLGLLLATNARLRDYVGPWVSFLYAVPLVAIAPLFIVAFGIGIMSKVVVIFLVAVFIILVNTEVGVLSTDPNLVEAARSFGASRAQIFRKVLLPAALPFIIAGLRLGVARSLVGVVVAELFGAKAGLGFLILASAQVFDTASLFVGVLVLAVGGYLGVELLAWVEKKLAPWRHFELRD